MEPQQQQAPPRLGVSSDVFLLRDQMRLFEQYPPNLGTHGDMLSVAGSASAPGLGLDSMPV